MPVARDLLLWCTPRQPYRIHVHAKADLPLAYQRLVSRRETLIDFRMLGDALPGCSTTGEKQHGCCQPAYPRDPFRFARWFKNLDEISETPVSHWFDSSLSWCVWTQNAKQIVGVVMTAPNIETT
jgi:hypothetical protein